MNLILPLILAIALTQQYPFEDHDRKSGLTYTHMNEGTILVNRPPSPHHKQPVDYIQYKDEDGNWSYYTPVRGTETVWDVDTMQYDCDWAYESYLFDLMETYGKDFNDHIDEWFQRECHPEWIKEKDDKIGRRRLITRPVVQRLILP